MLYCIVLYCIVLNCTVLCCTVLYCIVLYCNVLCCIVLHCIVLDCTILYCIVLHCVVLYCIVQYNTIYYNTIHYNTDPRKPNSQGFLRGRCQAQSQESLRFGFLGHSIIFNYFGLEMWDSFSNMQCLYQILIKNDVLCKISLLAHMILTKNNEAWYPVPKNPKNESHAILWACPPFARKSTWDLGLAPELCNCAGSLLRTMHFAKAVPNF